MNSKRYAPVSTRKRARNTPSLGCGETTEPTRAVSWCQNEERTCDASPIPNSPARCRGSLAGRRLRRQQGIRLVRRDAAHRLQRVARTVPAVAQEKGLFDKAGLKVELTYFVDYTASLDALVAGKVDVNAQTLNDTMLGVAAGSDQRIVVVNDNSTGNDAVICDSKITSVKDLKGKKIAAEAGVVDHFLLLQGLAKEGLKESDIEFSGLKTDAAAAAFAGGQFDCVAVFAGRSPGVEALKPQVREGLFSSVAVPGSISDHLVGNGEGRRPSDRPDMQETGERAGTRRSTTSKLNPADLARAIMAKKADLSVADYEDLEQALLCSRRSRRRRRSPSTAAMKPTPRSRAD